MGKIASGLSMGAKAAGKAAAKTDQEALVEAAKAADRAAAGRRSADVTKATAPMKMSEALGNLNVEGKGKLKVTQSDRTRVGGGNIGGAMFPGLSQVDPFYEGLVWGVGKKGTASSLINQSDPNTFWTTILGKEDQLKSNPLVFNRLYDAFKREAKAGLLDEELRQKINAGLEPEFGKGADILDPKLRQKINTFDKRVLVADLLLGKGIGGEQRGGSIIPGSAILRQETEPLLLHTKQGGDVPTFAVGPRLFSLSGEVKERPDLHPGFPFLLTGEDTGMVFKPVPGEEAMIDFMTRMQEAGKKPGYYEWTMGEAGRGLPSQDINEAYLTYLQKKGYAEGGDVGSPDVIPAIALDLENEYQSYAAGGATKMKLRKKSDQPAEEVGKPRPQLPQFGAGAPQEPSFIPEDPVQQMTVGSTNIPGQGGKFSKEDLADAFEKFRVLGGDYLRRGGPRGLPIDLALHLFGGKLPADVRELFGEGVPPESSFNPDELIEIEQKANGGPVHMQVGGQPPMDEIGYMMEAIDPTKESTGSPTFEAVKFMAPQIAKSLVSPFVGAYSTLTSGKYGTPEGIRAGEAAMERFMLPGEVNLSPEAEEKVMQAAKFMEELETKYKLPPLMPELFGPVTGAVQGMGPQARSLAGQGVAKAREAVSELPNLPVGLSIEAVGPGGKKLSVNDLIRMLEAGEEMTPEQRQKAEYSKAQKEKYAQANIARAQKEPAPKEEAVKVPASDLGFFSSVEKAAANLKREEGSGDAFLSDIMRFNPSVGELEATGIVDFLKGKKSVTRQEVQDYIDQHSVQIEEVVRGTILDDVDRQKLNDINRRISRGFGYTITPEEEEWFEATRERLAQFKEPRFEREGLILPNGKNYKEILLKFPFREPKTPRGYEVTKMEYDDGQVRFFANTPTTRSQGFKTEAEALEELNRLTEGLKDFRANLSAFRTDHWPDDPNTFMHLRMQDMTIDGKKTLVIEEIQSDWHQAGRKKGYAERNPLPVRVFDRNTGTEIGRFKSGKEAENFIAKEDPAMARLEYEEDFGRNIAGVPDAPFKKDWYQLGVKRLLKYAADNDYDQVALVGPDEQIRRGSLGTHIDGLIYEKNADGTIKLMAEKGQSVVLDKTVDPKDLDLYVGKDVAKRILDSKETEGTLTGDDLKIGGEGMRQYYGRNYPEYMNKLGRDYGTETKKTNFVIREYEPNDVEEVYTGEFDRYGREIIAYKVVDRETGEDIAFEYDFEKTLREANKKAPSTDMWLMDLPAKMKSDVKIGQPYKQGGAVKKRIGGPIYAPFNTKPDISDAGQLLDFGMEQELKRYG